MHSRFARFIFSLFNLKKNYVLSIPDSVSGAIWDETVTYLFEFNKTLITLASSTLVLSFAALQFNKSNSNVDKNSLIVSWMLFMWILIAGASVHFFNYLYVLTNQMIKTELKDTSISEEKFWRSKESLYYTETRKIIYFLSLSQLISFPIAFMLIIIVAIKMV
jgi:hypothetical protein